MERRPGWLVPGVTGRGDVPVTSSNALRGRVTELFRAKRANDLAAAAAQRQRDEEVKRAAQEAARAATEEIARRAERGKKRKKRNDLAGGMLGAVVKRRRAAERQARGGGERAAAAAVDGRMVDVVVREAPRLEFSDSAGRVPVPLDVRQRAVEVCLRHLNALCEKARPDASPAAEPATEAGGAVTVTDVLSKLEGGTTAQYVLRLEQAARRGCESLLVYRGRVAGHIQQLSRGQIPDIPAHSPQPSSAQ